LEPKSLYEKERIMKKFLENLIGILVYALVFCVFIGIGGWNLSVREIISLSLIFGFIVGSINNIERVLRDIFKDQEK
jgi:uncharacterized membrane protein YqgA involved in biofilm formation